MRHRCLLSLRRPMGRGPILRRRRRDDDAPRSDSGRTWVLRPDPCGALHGVAPSTVSFAGPGLAPLGGALSPSNGDIVRYFG